MSGIEWQNTFNTYIPEVDIQHKELVSYLNGLIEAVEKGRGSGEVENVLRRLVDYTREHFATEEKIMDEINYPHLLEHREFHEIWSTELGTFLQRLKEGREINEFEMIAFLQGWLINHIVKEDKKIGQSYIARLGTRKAAST